MEILEKNQKNISKYGFWVQPLLTYKDYFTVLLSHTSAYFILLFGITIIFGWISYIFQELGIQITIIDSIINSIFQFLLLLGVPFLFLFVTYKYTFYRLIVVNSSNVIGNNHTYSSIDELPIDLIFLSKRLNEAGYETIRFLKGFPQVQVSNSHSMRSLKSEGEMYMFTLFSWLAGWILLGFNFLFCGALFIFGFIIQIILEKVFPLTRFTYLAYMLQTITPAIESQSKEIQQNFQTDMNFRVLSDGFDSLSKTFSQIISLVIKLEGVEKRANKGNLFDSDKYINSIKGDIIEPLKSLRSFLEAKRVELELSQKELQKVRVGGSDELNFQSGLVSKRSESLLRELVENMNKLDSMIQKMPH